MTFLDSYAEEHKLIRFYILLLKYRKVLQDISFKEYLILYIY